MKSTPPFFKIGAEATLSEEILDGERVLVKLRAPKTYRAQELDNRLRKERTRSEAKLLREAARVVNVPRVMRVDEKRGEMVLEFVMGKPLKEVLAKKPVLCSAAGRCIRLLHDNGIIHGDLTTSNIIYVDPSETKKSEVLADRVAQKGSLFFIDFGLGGFSKKIEDKATDLVVFKKTFMATHSGIKNGWGKVLAGYAPSEELVARMEAIEKRARYH